MSKIILDRFRIFTGENAKSFFRGYVVIEDGIIAKVAQGEMELSDFPPGCVYIDGKNKIMMPGLINCHTHVYSALARGMALSYFTPKNFKELLEQLWWKLDRNLNEDAIYASAMVSAVEMVRNGITTFIDHHSSPNCISGSLRKLSEAMVDSCGLKGIFCYETSDRDGKNISEQSIQENISFSEYAKTRKGLIAGLFGIHASFTLEEETMKKIAETGLPVHVHIGEAIEDGELHKKIFSLTATERLDKFSVLKPGSLLSHCINVEADDLEIIKERKCNIVINPQSNMNNGVGLPDFENFGKIGINVLLGNDGYGYDLTRDIRVLPLSQRLLRHDALNFSMEDLFEVVFKNSSEYVSGIIGSDIGRIEEGYQADVITFDYREPTEITPDNFLSHYYFGIIENCKPVDVISRGVFLKKNMEILLPERDIFEYSKKIAAEIWRKM